MGIEALPESSMVPEATVLHPLRGRARSVLATRVKVEPGVPSEIRMRRESPEVLVPERTGGWGRTEDLPVNVKSPTSRSASAGVAYRKLAISNDTARLPDRVKPSGCSVTWTLRMSKLATLGAMLPCPGYSDEVIHLFLARNLVALSEQPPGDDDEDLEVLLMQPAELDAVLASGDEHLDGKSVTAWFRARQLLGL